MLSNVSFNDIFRSMAYCLLFEPGTPGYWWEVALLKVRRARISTLAVYAIKGTIIRSPFEPSLLLFSPKLQFWFRM